VRTSATARVLRDARGGSFRFDAGAACLDFAHTGGEGRYAVFETLHKPDDLARWVAQPPLFAVIAVPVTGRELTQAKALRRAIWDAAHDRAARRLLAAKAVATINCTAASPPLIPVLDATGATSDWAPPTRVTQALSTLAREMIELLSGPLAERIRECAADDCPLVFVDTSRPNARRWCAMERCGNRHKLRTHRARHTVDGEASGYDGLR
jgi:predicted RNA-binding Zn ribbon-like protein